MARPHDPPMWPCANCGVSVSGHGKIRFACDKYVKGEPGYPWMVENGKLRLVPERRPPKRYPKKPRWFCKHVWFHAVATNYRQCIYCEGQQIAEWSQYNYLTVEESPLANVNN